VVWCGPKVWSAQGQLLESFSQRKTKEENPHLTRMSDQS
jgi:hypothetical protein